MSLVRGWGPFGRDPAGSFNFPVSRPDSVLYLERSPRWVRARFGGQTVADSRRAMLLHDPASLPSYYIPAEDVRIDLLTPSGREELSETKGPQVFYTLSAGGRTAEDAAWTFPSPPSDARGLAGHFAFSWPALEAWLEEDEEVYVHARDPYHRVDALRSTRHVTISLDDAVLADSAAPVALFETAQPTRWYLPAGDVRTDLLRPEPDRTSRCPYKGTATYWSAEVEARREPMLAWTYSDPRPGVAAIAGRICFFNERVDTEVDGERQARPVTAWASTDWIKRLEQKR